MTDTVQLIEPPRRVTTRAKTRRRRAFWRKCLVGVAAFLLVSFGTLCVLFGSISATCHVLSQAIGLVRDRAYGTPPFHGKRQVRILLLGTDVAFGKVSRTDTMKLITVDLDKERISMLSIPRDTWVELPNGTHNRINSAHQLGGRDRQKAVALATQTVTDLLTDLAGQPVQIDYYVRIQTEGFVKIVDALGGVDIDVEKRMKYHDNWQSLNINLYPGMQHLNGKQAMGYVRFRHDREGDYARMERQDKFIRVLAEQMRGKQKSRRMLRMVGALMDMLSTDLSANDVIAMKKLVDKVGMNGIQSAQLPTVPTLRGAAQVVEVQDRVAAAQVIDDMLYGPRTTVVVLNGSQQQGLARDVREHIDAAAYNVVGVGTTEAPVETTTIFTSDRDKKTATKLASALGVSGPVETKSAPPTAKQNQETLTETAAQITIVLGRDYSAPQDVATSTTY